MKKEDIIKNKYGKYVSKVRSEAAKANSHLGKWLFKKDGKPSNKSATALLYETIAKERELERKTVVPGRLYKKQTKDSMPNPKPKASKPKARKLFKKETKDSKPVQKPIRKLYKKETKDSKPNTLPRLSKDIMRAAVARIESEGWKVVPKKKKPALTEAQKRPKAKAKPIKRPRKPKKRPKKSPEKKKTDIVWS